VLLLWGPKNLGSDLLVVLAGMYERGMRGRWLGSYRDIRFWPRRLRVTLYAPLTSTETYPVHGWDYGEAAEYACRRPEDPDCLQFDWRCPACLLAAQASIENLGDREIAWRQSADSGETVVALSWLIDRSIYWLFEADR
jgi:hypothetical protein